MQIHIQNITIKQKQTGWAISSNITSNPSPKGVVHHNDKLVECQRSAKNLKVLGPGPTWSENDGPFLPKYGPWSVHPRASRRDFFPALLVEEDPRCPSGHYFRHERIAG
jgi:hypothetical protein